MLCSHYHSGFPFLLFSWGGGGGEGAGPAAYILANTDYEQQPLGRPIGHRYRQALGMQAKVHTVKSDRIRKSGLEFVKRVAVSSKHAARSV